MPAGILATITMDATMSAASACGGSAFTSDRLSLDAIGRWSGGLARGQWHQADAGGARTTRVGQVLGLLTHYVTGVILTQGFLLLPRRGGARPGFGAALAFGLATAALPLRVLFPSLGYGTFGLRTGDAPRLIRIMLVGHAGFGIGIGL